MGCSRPYVTLMRNGKRSVPMDFALRLHLETGALIGPIVDASDQEILVLRKFILSPLLASERAQ